MKVSIDCDKRLVQRGGTEYEGGWYYYDSSQRHDSEFTTRSRQRFETYADARAELLRNGHELDNAGWKHKLLMWNWHSHSFDGFPGWEIENKDETDKYARHPAYAKLEHINKKTLGSDDLCNAWDDIAEVDFYQRDYSYDGSVSVSDGEAYGSGWWFATIAERDRFVAWAAEKMKEKMK